MIRESDLYIPVRDFIKEKYGCFHAIVEAGEFFLGSVDVLGIRYRNPEKSEVETIGVEIKTRKNRMCASLGQAKGYSLFCHRVYFASLSYYKFGIGYIDEQEAAKNLGIGLIGIEEKGKTFVCTELLEAPIGNPLSKLLNAVLRQKGILRCDSCNEFKHYSYRDRVYVDGEKSETLEKAKKQITNKDKMLIIRGTSRGTYCNECAKRKLGLS